MDRPLDRKGLSTITDHLIYQMFGSNAVVGIDSIIVSSLYGQRARKKEHRLHRMQTLASECVVDSVTCDMIYSTFEEGKAKLFFGFPEAYIKTTMTMAGSLYRSSSLLKSHGAESKAIIEWCIAAYSMVINPESSVKLSCVKMGPAEKLGFAVHAIAPIKNGQVLQELIGLMPKDNRAKHSEVSCITPSGCQNQSTRVERILFGPIRFINHICLAPNAEYVAVPETSGFFVQATEDIAPGQEILVDYGKGWFADEPGGCPCLTCQPDLHAKKRQKVEKDDATIKEEKAACKKLKRKRNKIKRTAEWTTKMGHIVGSLSQ